MIYACTYVNAAYIMVNNIHGANNHHKVESSFKALGVALRQAVSKDDTAGVPSTKGVLA